MLEARQPKAGVGTGFYTNREVCIVDEGWNSTVRRGHMTILVRQFCIGGSVVEFSPATREARVRFPANAIQIFYLDYYLVLW